MEIILIVMPKSRSMVFEKKKIEYMREQIKGNLALKIHEQDTAVLIASGNTDEWQILSNKFNKDLFEKYSKFVKEKMDEINYEKEKIQQN